jgi:polyferredoxin
MDKVGRPHGLIAFDTYANGVARRRGETPHRRFLRPRTFVYAAILLLVAAAMIVMLAERGLVEVSVLADRNPLFVRLSDGSIRDGYTLKIENKAGVTQAYALSAEGLPGALLHVAELENAPAPSEQGMTLAVKGDSIGTFRVYLQAPKSDEHETHFHFVVRDIASGETARYDATFRGPEH